MAEIDRILASKLLVALGTIKAQLYDGYIDLGAHDELELYICRSAVAAWEESFIKRLRKNWRSNGGRG